MSSTDTDRPIFANADVPMHRDDQGRLWFFPVDERTFTDEVMTEASFPTVVHVWDSEERSDVDTDTVRRILRSHFLEVIQEQWGLDWLQAIGLNVLDDLIVRARDRKDDSEVAFLHGVADGYEVEVADLRRHIAGAVPA